jgi:hypothetical protein
MKKKLAHGDIRDLEAISSDDFKKEMMEVTQNELQIQATSKTEGKKTDDRLIRKE